MLPATVTTLEKPLPPLPPLKDTVAEHVTRNVQALDAYGKLLMSDKPEEAGQLAFALGLTWKHDPYNMKGSKKESRDPSRSAKWVNGWNTAKAQSEGTA